MPPPTTMPEISHAESALAIYDQMAGLLSRVHGQRDIGRALRRRPRRRATICGAGYDLKHVASLPLVPVRGGWQQPGEQAPGLRRIAAKPSITSCVPSRWGWNREQTRLRADNPLTQVSAPYPTMKSLARSPQDSGTPWR